MKIPKYRFPEFKDAWNEVDISDILQQRKTIQRISGDAPLLSFTIEEGVINPEDKKTNKRDFLMKDKDNKKFLLTELDDIIYNPANIKFGAIHRNKLQRGVVSPIYVTLTTEEVPAFVENLVRRTSFINSSKKYLEGTVEKLKTLKADDFLKLRVVIPPTRNEQEKIADCLSSVDAVIADYEAQVENMQNQKKGVMQKLFSQEVRFKADDGSEYPEWEKVHLGDIGSFSKGNGLSWDSIDDNGSYECILYGNLYTDYGAVIDEIVYRTNDFSDKKSSIGDILIPASDTTPTGLARASCIMVENVLLGGDINILSPNEDIYGPCLSYCINANRTELLKVVQGSTVRHLKGSDLKGIAIYYPNSLGEQLKIAKCLSAFDEAIKNLQETVEHWKNIKKGLLQQLFV